MNNIKEIHDLCKKMLAFLKKPNKMKLKDFLINSIKSLEEFGFKKDKGNTFIKYYGIQAFEHAQKLEEIIDDIGMIWLLAQALASKLYFPIYMQLDLENYILIEQKEWILLVINNLLMLSDPKDVETISKSEIIFFEGLDNTRINKNEVIQKLIFDRKLRTLELKLIDENAKLIRDEKLDLGDKTDEIFELLTSIFLIQAKKEEMNYVSPYESSGEFQFSIIDEEGLVFRYSDVCNFNNPMLKDASKKLAKLIAPLKECKLFDGFVYN